MMNAIAVRHCLASVIAVAACGADDRGTTCHLDDYPDVAIPCLDAIRVAATASGELRPSGNEVAEVFRVIERARRVESACFDELRQPEVVSLKELTVRVSDGTITEAWDAGEILTGIEDVDRILADSGATGVEGADGAYTLFFAYPANCPEIQEAFQRIGVDSSLVAGPDVAWSGIEFQRSDGGYVVTFKLGLGDCFPGCPYHYWDVGVSQDVDSAHLLGERGEPVPDGVTPCGEAEGAGG